METHLGRKTVKNIAQLEDGAFVEYDFCSESRDAYANMDLEYLGQGTHYSSNGIRQCDERTLHFFRKRGG